MHSALESILLSVSASLEAESIYFHDRVGSLLRELEDEIDSEEYTRLLRYARRVGSFESRARLVSAHSLLPGSAY
jgi:magnesium transporter